MKPTNIKKYFSVVLGIIVCLNPIHIINNKKNLQSGALYRYSEQEKNEFTKESKWCQKYYNRSLFNPYFNFIIDANKKLETPATHYAKDKFDNLFDNTTSTKIWKNFSALNNTLTNWKLSSEVKLDLDWNKAYSQANVNAENIKILDDLQLRFYTIIAKVFGITNILKIVQKIVVNNDLNYYSKTIYFPKISAIAMEFNKFFCDISQINYEHQINHFATNVANIASIHEYGQALIVYAYNNQEQRKEFNTKIINNYLNSQKLKINNNYRFQKFSDASIFNDVTESLIWHLVNNSGIDTGNDSVKKMLIPFLVINSTESRMGWIINNVYARDRLFTEAFAKWLGTKSSDRDFSWQLLNAYFIRLFPVFYHFQ